MTTDPNSPVKLAEYSTELEAGPIIAALEQQGIEARMVGDLVSGFRVEVPGVVSVLVRQQDLEQAQAALKALEQVADPVDWTKVDTGDSTPLTPEE